MMRISFFATGGDLRPVLRRAEAEVPLKFIPAGVTTSSIRPIHLRSEDMPDIGTSKYDTGQSNSYLVSLQHAKNWFEKFRDDNGIQRWHLHNGGNPNTVTLQAGGLWKDEVLLDGGVSTLHDTPVAQRLMRLFLASIRQERFTNLEDWWFGPEAFRLWRDGGRLTHSAQSPPEFDFEFPEELRQLPLGP